MILDAISLEIYKYKKNPVILFLVIFFLILTPVASLVSNEFAQLQDNLPFKSGNIMEFPAIWDWMGYLGSWMCFFFLGVIAIYIVTTEASYKTMRQNIINGQTRQEFYLSKIFIIVFLAILATIYYVLWTVALGVINAESLNWSEIFENDWAIPRYLLMTLSFMIFAFFLAIMLKKSGLAVFIYLTYVMALESILRWGIHKKIFGIDYMNYYPMNAAEDLMPFPMYKLAENLPDGDSGFELLSYGHASIVCLFFIALFLFLSYRNFMQKDM
jgi:hypothetical protein